MSVREPRRIPERVGRVVVVMTLAVAVASCAEDLGACEGFSETLNGSYCNDGWTSAECAEWDAMGVNAADWFFHSGQTCEDRGFQIIDGNAVPAG